MNQFIFLMALAASLIHCTHTGEQQINDLNEILKSEHRSKENKARDAYRHPKETLEFFAVKPTMTVIEISPGAGWYTEILAPYLSQGELYLAAFSDDSSREYYRSANKKLKEAVKRVGSQAGGIYFTVFEMPDKIGPIAPANSADRVLTFRNVHNWAKAGKAKEAFEEFFRALKPGGILGVVEHREASKNKPDPKAKSGYMQESTVISLAESAGFKLLAKSEINANPKDNAKHPEGVWTLPPSLKLGEKDKEKYIAIGESDRMTLKFIKPE